MGWGVCYPLLVCAAGHSGEGTARGAGKERWAGQVGHHSPNKTLDHFLPGHKSIVYSSMKQKLHPPRSDISMSTVDSTALCDTEPPPKRFQSEFATDLVITSTEQAQRLAPPPNRALTV